ncbi:MAG TPA: sulfite exporter TauE/SafE family protein [bacterium]
MPVASWIVDIALGAALGFLGGLFGTGGGVILIPLLGLFFGYTQQVAQGTAMVTVVSNVYVGAWLYARRHDIPIRLGLALGTASLLFTYVAARIAVVMDPQLLRGCFAVFLAGVACLLMWKGFFAPGEVTAGAPRFGRKWLPALGVPLGLIGGFLGVGMGAITPPILTGLFGMTQVVAQGLTLTLAVPSVTVFLITFGHAGLVNWQVGLLIAVGGLVTLNAGVALAHRLPERKLRGTFGVFLLISALALLLASLR